MPSAAAGRRIFAERKHRTQVATFDGHSWIWPYRPQTAEQVIENFEGYPPYDFGVYWYGILGADLVSYPSRIGTIPGEGTEDFSRPEHLEYTRSVKTLIEKGVNPLLIAKRAAREQGREFHVFVRPAAWQASIPWEGSFNSQFYRDHPEWRCVDREGRQAMFMSYTACRRCAAGSSTSCARPSRCRSPMAWVSSSTAASR